MISCNGDEENSTHDSVIIRGWEDYSDVMRARKLVSGLALKISIRLNEFFL